MQEPFVHILSKITSNFTESRPSHGQWNPQTYLQLTICGTSLGDLSGHCLIGHRTSTSLLVHSGRNGTRSPKQLLGGLSEAWGVIVSCAWRWMEAILPIETSVKLVCWPLSNSKSSSSHMNFFFLICWWSMCCLCIIFTQLHEIINLIQNKLFHIIFKY